MQQNDPSIAYLELYALCVRILTWQVEPVLRDSRIRVFCDNVAVVEMINSMVSSCRNCMYLLRLLALNGLRFNRRLSAQYLDTRSNYLVDALSWNQMNRF